MQIEEEFIIKARAHFANIDLLCIEDAKSGKDKVNDLDEYIDWHMKSHDRSLVGDFDSSFTHRQYAYYLQTGTMNPLLP